MTESFSLQIFILSQALNQSQTMDGCSAPLVVKFADTHKDKEQKKFHQMQASLISSFKGAGTVTGAISPGCEPIASPLSTTNGSAQSNIPMNLNLSGSVQANNLVNLPNATALTSNPSLITNPPRTCNPFIGSDALSTSSLQFLQQMQAVGLHQQMLQGN